MKMRFKQRLFSWFDSYDIYAENGAALYTVKGQLSWGHCFKIYDAQQRELGMVKEQIVTLLPKFQICQNGHCLGTISRNLTLLRPRYDIDFLGWNVVGSVLEWDYRITDRSGREIASVTKELFHLTDQYTISVQDPANALYALMLVLAIDAEKCSRSKA